MTTLTDLLGKIATVAALMGYPSAYLPVPDEFGFCLTQACQSIGLGLFTAIGAALARPGRLPVATIGGGGFRMGISELETLVRLRIPMVVVVYNDHGYGAEVHHFADADHTAVTFPDTDIAAIARGYGADGGRCTAPPISPRSDSGSTATGRGRC